MSLWIQGGAVVVMAAIGMTAVWSMTPKRHPGRHAPDATLPREEAGADVAYAAELHDLGERIAEEPALVPDEPGDEEAEPAEPEPEPVDPEIEQPSPDEPSWWGLPPAASEATPIFQEAGRYPQAPDFETFTHGWKRDDLQRALRAEEARQAGVRAA